MIESPAANALDDPDADLTAPPVVPSVAPSVPVKPPRKLDVTEPPAARADDEPAKPKSAAKPKPVRPPKGALNLPPLDDSKAGYAAAPKLDAGLWRRILTHVRLTHPSLNRVWFDTLVPRQLSNGVVHVVCETVAQLNFLTGQCQEPFTAACQAVTARLGMVMFHCEQIRPGGVFDDHDRRLPLSPDYTFEHFVVGPGNQLAHSASLAVADRPGTNYNPLFIHGGVGLGKTHLLQAICQRLLECRPTARILYLSCDSFISQFMNAVEAGDMNAFRHKFRNADVLVVDDIHFFAGRERTQEEFFHTFNTLQQAGKQIILSADAPPKEIPAMEERLVSRFGWGLVTPVERPQYETRVAILRKKARMRGMEVGDDVICYLAAKIESNIRELEGAITKVQGLSQLNDNVIDLDLAKKSLGDAGDAGDRGEADLRHRITINHILDAVTRYYGVKVADLQGKKRNKSIVFPRQICMYLARRHTRYSLGEVGGYFGGRDHTTVLHAVRTIKAHVEKDPDVQRQVLAIENGLTGLR